MFNADLLQEQVIVVTGGGSGLGKSMALRLGELGARLVLTGRRQQVLDEAVAEIEAKGGQALAVSCDVRVPEQVDAMVARGVEHYGQLNGLINNAAGNFLCPTEELSPKAFSAVVGIVLHGTFHCTLAVGKQLIAQGGGGSILSITTTYAESGSSYVVPSACGKAGVLVLMKSLAVEWAKYGIRCNAIAPGPFPTPGAWERLVPPDFSSEMGNDHIPARRFGEHSELANLAAYLMSAQAGYITGQQVTIDGGGSLMAGLFNSLTLRDPVKVAQVMRSMRPKK